MKELVFRAKAEHDNNWCYGLPIHYESNPRTEKWTIREKSGLESDVAEETISQFTGLKDKKGSDIYEGDIVLWEKDSKKYVVVFRSGMFYASVEELNEGIYGGFPLWYLCVEEQHCHIVGNIHDNPELLKKKK